MCSFFFLILASKGSAQQGATGLLNMEGGLGGQQCLRLNFTVIPKMAILATWGHWPSNYGGSGDVVVHFYSSFYCNYITTKNDSNDT